MAEVGQVAARISETLRELGDQVADASRTQSASASLAVGKIWEIDGELDAAEEAYTRATCRDPDLAEAFARLALTQAKNGNRSGAIRTASRLLSSHPGATFGSLLQRHQVSSESVFGEVLLGAGRTDAATEAFERALEVNPGDPLACSRLTRLSLASGNADRAVKLVSDSTATGPDLERLGALARLGSTGNKLLPSIVEGLAIEMPVA